MFYKYITEVPGFSSAIYSVGGLRQAHPSLSHMRNGNNHRLQDSCKDYAEIIHMKHCKSRLTWWSAELQNIPWMRVQEATCLFILFWYQRWRDRAWRKLLLVGGLFLAAMPNRKASAQETRRMIRQQKNKRKGAKKGLSLSSQHFKSGISPKYRRTSSESCQLLHDSPSNLKHKKNTVILQISWTGGTKGMTQYEEDSHTLLSLPIRGGADGQGRAPALNAESHRLNSQYLLLKDSK